jgi:hypothetical protein
LHMVWVPTSTKATITINTGKMSVRKTIVWFYRVAIENFKSALRNHQVHEIHAQ